MNDWFGASSNTSIVHPLRDLPVRGRLINLLNIRITSGLNMFSAWWHMIGVADHRRRS